ncbi:uncharacterized protein PHALS_00159 [Plasmopara halstedii]|uniref:Uncharacterized protein n=1 Tax=Plasmopara halstedii TaxID=4781 RepID=A0A0P1A5L4_PLAHL|nr:uncharacterized protein PHALS_00159 [Plasmopara halstedii]CEG35830.1 hypothetical protein PHALS_00159 [Plasmopara halstedii]|eukprot:XP_024572199.1 hypothetical protein PHALS_00159 [Plasmopara halstedii]
MAANTETKQCLIKNCGNEKEGNEAYTFTFAIAMIFGSIDIIWTGRTRWRSTMTGKTHITRLHNFIEILKSININGDNQQHLGAVSADCFRQFFVRSEAAWDMLKTALVSS